MKKRITMYFVFTYVFLSVLVTNTYAADYINATSCSGFLLASAGTVKGSYTDIACYGTYQEAKNAMNVSTDDNAFILKGNEVIDAKYALIDYDFSRTRTTTLYADASSGSALTYFNPAGGSSDDAAFLDYNPTNNRIKIKLSGAVGWIDKKDDAGLLYYEIHPVNWVKSPTYYQFLQRNDTGNVYSVVSHSFTENMYGSGTVTTYQIGVNTTGIANSDLKYYSYDGIYFYSNLKTMLYDYKNNINSNAANANSPYYNYYQYITFRSETSYSKENLNQYIKENVIRKYKVYNESNKLYETGSLFLKEQSDNGINAAMMLGIGMNESAIGGSNNAINNNNLFGLGAIDSDAENGDVFPSIADCIYKFARGWLSYGYVNPFDYRWYGANLGNKKQGANIKYASDPYWGEKASTYYFNLDSYFGLQDYNKYPVAVLNNDSSTGILPRKTPSTTGLPISSVNYKYKYKGTPVVILGEVNAEGKTWYKIMSDAVLNENQEMTGGASGKLYPQQNYNRNYSFGYVLASDFTKISTVSAPVIPNTQTISSIITGAGYNLASSKIYGLKVGSSIDELKTKLTVGGSVVTSDRAVVSTGTTISITKDGTTESFQLVVYGDSNGSGNIDAVDYSVVKSYIMRTNDLTGAYRDAADVNKDGAVDALDYANIKNYIMGNSNVISN
ncbi:MAG: dockerin type I domain-containing protein [Bacilli bacterium]|nr:dockerin type I domain-containing protein [Bacilli bacterium]